MNLATLEKTIVVVLVILTAVLIYSQLPDLVTAVLNHDPAQTTKVTL